MPIYEYRCGHCGERFEKLVRSDDKEPVRCPHCESSEVQKVISRLSAIRASLFGGRGGSCAPTGG